MKPRYFIPLLLIFFLILAIIYLANLYFFAKECQGFIIGDWLINYNGGFVRRGLSGETAIMLADFIGVKPNAVVMMLQSLFYIGYMCMFFLLLHRKKMTAWYFIMLISPATLFFPVLDLAAVGRKEVILFCLFTAFLLLLNKGYRRSTLLMLLFSLSLAVATLFHEMIFFYTPYFILAVYLSSRLKGERFSILKAAPLVLMPMLVIIPTYFFGRDFNSYAICVELMDKGLPENVCNGIISWPSDFGMWDVYRIAWHGGYFYSYTIAFILGSIPFCFFVAQARSAQASLKKFLIALVVLIALTLPLFFMAVDWGRWINIHFMMCLFTLTMLLRNRNEAQVNDVNSFSPDLFPKWQPTRFWGKAAVWLVLTLLCGVYIFFWHMAHFGKFSVLSVENYKFIRYAVHGVIALFQEIRSVCFF
jgi:hypothetical protein